MILSVVLGRKGLSIILGIVVKSDFGKTVNPPSQISIGVSEKEGGNSEKENGDRCNCACPQRGDIFLVHLME